MISQSDLDAFDYYHPDNNNNTAEELRLLNMSPQDMVEDYYNKAGIKPDPYLCSDLIREEFSEWIDANFEKYFEEDFVNLFRQTE